MDHAVEQPQALGANRVGSRLVCQGRYIPRFGYSFEGKNRWRLLQINLQLSTQHDIPILGKDTLGHQPSGCKAECKGLPELVAVGDAMGMGRICTQQKDCRTWPCHSGQPSNDH